MEKYVFVREGNGMLPIRVPECMYEKIMQLVVVTKKQVTNLLVKDRPDDLLPRSVLHEVDVGAGLNDQTNSIFVKDRDYFRRIEFNCIRWIEASGSYSCLRLENASKLMLSFNLRELSEHLPSRIFVRVHRSYIVNVDFIDSFIGNVLCIGKDQIPVSKQHKQYVIGRLNILGSVR